MTTTLYDDGLLTEFEAIVTECVFKDDVYWIALDQTAFYVEAGGMKSDKGTLNHIEVIDLKIENEVIYHLVKEPIEGKVIGKVDFKDRLQKIQIHTAQHLISHILSSQYHAKTMSHHVYGDSADIEFDILDLSQEDIQIIQDKVNDIIDEDYLISISYPSYEEAIKHAPVEKLQHEHLRVVSIGDLDYNLCGCLHVLSTLWIKGIVITKVTKIKQGIRLEYIAGNLAFDYICNRVKVLEASTNLLAMPHMEIAEGISKLQSSVKETLVELNQYRNLYFDLLVEQELKVLDLSTTQYLIKEYAQLEVKDVQNIVARYMKQDNIVLAAILYKQDSMHIVFANSKNIVDSNAKEDFMMLIQKYNFKGGGNLNLAQGGGPIVPNIKQIIQRLWNLNEN